MRETQARLRPAGPDDVRLLATLLAGLSPASAFHRFMAGLGGPKPGPLRGLLRAGGGRGAWLAVGRGAGLGRALFEAAGTSAAGAGATVVPLDVHPDNRRVARILRDRLGARAIT